jgi:hypothetical protein
VLVATSGDVVVLPWQSREALLAQMRLIDAARSAVDAFEAVGTSRPFKLEVDAKRALVDSICRGRVTPVDAAPPSEQFLSRGVTFAALGGAAQA